jgi:hypothetical protein
VAASLSFFGSSKPLGVQQHHHAPRYHHRQSASGVHHGQRAGFPAVQPIEIERTQLRLDELQELAGQRHLARLVRAEDQIELAHAPAGNLFTDVGLGDGGQSEGFEDGADDAAGELVADAFDGAG